jgi:hypothetical protein
VSRGTRPPSLPRPIATTSPARTSRLARTDRPRRRPCQAAALHQVRGWRQRRAGNRA